MPVPAAFAGRLKLPAIVSPMFLVSGPELVAACCRAGLVGTFPALNQRTTEGYEAWLDEIEAAIGPDDAPYGVNLIVHGSNTRLEADLAVTVRRRVPLVITSLGAVKDVVDAVHSYGGLVFHDVINRRHAEKAAEAGVDGIIAVCAGAGGHAGTLSPFALVSEIRSVFAGTIVLAGAMSSGAHVLAARALGADLAYMGTRFIATQEAPVHQNVKDAIVAATELDTRLVMRPLRNTERVLRNAAVDRLIEKEKALGANIKFEDIIEEVAGVYPKIMTQGDMEAGAWSCGMVAGLIHDVPTVKQLIDRIMAEAEAIIRQRLTGFLAA